MGTILAVCLNPTFQRTFVVPHLWENEVLRSSEYYYDVAGKGLNTARILTQLGCDAMHLTHLGGSFIDQFLEENSKANLKISWVDSDSEIRTCYTIINAETHTTTEIVEEPQEVSPGTEELVMERFRSLLPQIDTLVISGSIAPGYSDGLYPSMVREAKLQHKRVVLDIRGQALLDSMQYRPDVINPNFVEFAGTFLPELPIKEHEDDEQVRMLVEAKMLEINRTYGAACVLTHGSRPTLFVEDGQIRQSPVKRIVPVNTIGSGDAFTAGYVSIMIKGGTVGEAVHKGQECGTLNALHIRPGTLY
ncbi:MAG: tagatose-6-phosphate kinase [Spirochaetia bacterium]|nr:tagatose-6-phosphate kinase [Spirochaetia bacterium]